MHTVGQVIEALLPDGTLSHDEGPPEYRRHAPAWPGDVFGVAAYLLDRSGAYQRVIAIKGTKKVDELRYASIVIDDNDRKKVQELAEKWKVLPKEEQDYAPKGVDEYWEILSKSWNKPLVTHIAETQSQPPDWRHCTAMLMMIADTAAEGLGYASPEGTVPNWIHNASETGTLLDFDQVADKSYEWMKGWVHNWTFQLNQSICCVVPKSSAPEVGCTLRALSANLALTPSIGEVRANWWMHRDPPAKDNEALNLLLVPFPFWIPSRSFVGIENKHGNHVFEVDQTWLVKEKADDFKKFLGACVDNAKLQVGTVHGLVLPELSLNEAFRKMISEFAHSVGIRLVISGMLGDKDSRMGVGNQVLAEVNLTIPIKESRN